MHLKGFYVISAALCITLVKIYCWHAGVPELSGILQGRLPTFRIVTDDRGQSRAVFSAITSGETTTASYNLPSPAILGNLPFSFTHTACILFLYF